MSFMEHLPELVVQYGYIAIFVVIALESAGVPMPGETVLILLSPRHLRERCR